MKMDLDTRIFDAKMTLLRRNSPEARTIAVKVQADVFIDYLVRKGPRDTNRFVRSFIQAGNQAGLRPRPMPALQRSRKALLISEALRKSVKLSTRNLEIWSKRLDNAERMEKLYRTNGRTHYKYFKKILTEKSRIQKEVRFHTKRLDAAIREMEQFIDGGGANAFTGVAIGTWGIRDRVVDVPKAIRRGTGSAYVIRRGVLALRRNIQIETKEYGGSGRTEVVGDYSFAHMTSHEPHARFVNRRFGILGDALRETRVVTGGKRITRQRYVLEVAKGTGMADLPAGKAG